MNKEEYLLNFIDKMTKPELPQERIYGWLDSQMSIARHYGGLRWQGHEYFISPNEEGQPLVRADVLKREAAEKKRAERSVKLACREKQGEL
jgi:hypothetical protein